MADSRQQFTLASGLQGGTGARYFFEFNPTAVQIPEPEINYLKPLNGQMIRQRPWVSYTPSHVAQNTAQPYIFTWTSMKESQFQALRGFAQRDGANAIRVNYLYDGIVGHFPVVDSSVDPAILSGTPVKILDVYGQAVPNQYTITFPNPVAQNRMNVTMKILKVW